METWYSIYFTLYLSWVVYVVIRPVYAAWSLARLTNLQAALCRRLHYRTVEKKKFLMKGLRLLVIFANLLLFCGLKAPTKVVRTIYTPCQIPGTPQIYVIGGVGEN